MLAIIVAIGPHNLIGKGNDLPWHYSEDLKYFKEVTLNKSVFMGYNTFLSIYNRLGKALTKRKNYVLTYEETLPGGAIPIHDLKELPDEDIFVIGGKMIYEMMLPYVDMLYITHVNKEYDGDVFFPEIPFENFELVSSRKSGDLDFCVYKKRPQKGL